MENKENTEMMNENKPYTLRPLKDKDLWPVLDIVGKVFPDDLSTAFMGVVTGNKTIQEIGSVVAMRLITAVIRNMKLVHDDVYAFLSDVSGLTVEEMEEMEFGTTPRMIWDIVKNEKNSGFFGEFSKLS